jgi:hypothetical protein
MSFRRGALIYFFFLAAILILAVQCKPAADKLEENVSEALTLYAASKTGSADTIRAAADALDNGAANEEVARAIANAKSQDWLVARSYALDFDGERFSCWGAFVLTVCDGPEE